MGWGEETFFLQVFFMGRKNLDDKFHGKHCNECGRGGGGDFDLGDFFESRVSRRDIGKI